MPAGSPAMHAGERHLARLCGQVVQRLKMRRSTTRFGVAQGSIGLVGIGHMRRSFSVASVRSRKRSGVSPSEGALSGKMARNSMTRSAYSDLQIWVRSCLSPPNRLWRIARADPEYFRSVALLGVASPPWPAEPRFPARAALQNAFGRNACYSVAIGQVRIPCWGRMTGCRPLPWQCAKLDFW